MIAAVTAGEGAGDRDPARVLERPRGFYITRRLDRRLDRAVAYLKEQHGLRKVDRSVLVTTLLDREELWTEAALDGLVEEVAEEVNGRQARLTD
jgi:hypothetical protein